MESEKCPACGLVNWSDNESISCKRCGAPLWVKEAAPKDYSSVQPEAQGILSGLNRFFLTMLGAAVLALLLRHVFRLFDKDMGLIISATFIFTGLVFLFLAHFWLLARIFEQSTGWGLASLFFPLVGWIAVATFWDKVKRAFFAQLICAAIIIAGYLIGA